MGNENENTPGVGERREPLLESLSSTLVSITDPDARKAVSSLITDYVGHIADQMSEPTRQQFAFIAEGLNRPSTEFKKVEIKTSQIMQSNPDGSWVATPLEPTHSD
jgi:hypothetical protein